MTSAASVFAPCRSEGGPDPSPARTPAGTHLRHGDRRLLRGPRPFRLPPSVLDLPVTRLGVRFVVGARPRIVLVALVLGFDPDGSVLVQVPVEIVPHLLMHHTLLIEVDGADVITGGDSNDRVPAHGGVECLENLFVCHFFLNKAYWGKANFCFGRHRTTLPPNTRRNAINFK